EDVEGSETRVSFNCELQADSNRSASRFGRLNLAENVRPIRGYSVEHRAIAVLDEEVAAGIARDGNGRPDRMSPFIRSAHQMRTMGQAFRSGTRVYNQSEPYQACPRTHAEVLGDVVREIAARA